MAKDLFVNGANVVVFEHLIVDRKLRTALNRHLANPLDRSLAAEVDQQLSKLVKKKIDKYNHAELKSHIKLVYSFLMKGMQGMASGQSLAEEEEKRIKQAFGIEPRPNDFPILPIRTTFLADPTSRCEFAAATRELVPLLLAQGQCRLNLIHTKYFIDLFKKGRWGSNLEDPISAQSARSTSRATWRDSIELADTMTTRQRLVRIP